MSIDRRILIADDDSEVRLGAADLLGPMGLEILQAERGDDALRIVRSESIHLALLDVHMPGRGGLEVLSAVREETLGVPCILWSGDATEAIEKVARRGGVSAFLHKPVRPDFLRAEVRRVLEDHWGRPA